MKTYDWMVVGAGIAGATLSYELIEKGFDVLLLDRNGRGRNATSYSYGGLAYWSGTSELTRQLCAEGIEIHRHLSEALAAETEFREIDLILTIEAGENPQTLAAAYSHFAIPPQLLSPEEACEREPLLEASAISGALKLPHGHVHPHKTNQAYRQAFLRRGGEIHLGAAVRLLRRGNAIVGVATASQNFYAQNTAVCAGAFSRSLLAGSGIQVRLYFTHAHLIQTPPTDLHLRTLVMPASQKRFSLEAWASQPEREPSWDRPSREVVASALDPGAVQFLDGSFCLGQLSQIATDPNAAIDVAGSEAKIRQGIGRILPLLENIPGTARHCLVAFAHHSLPLVGEIPPFRGLSIFSGFTSPLVFAPPLARHFARWAAGERDSILPLEPGPYS